MAGLFHLCLTDTLPILENAALQRLWLEPRTRNAKNLPHVSYPETIATEDCHRVAGCLHS